MILDWKYVDQEFEGKYFSSVWYESKPSTGVWLLYSKSAEGLGFIKWYAPWRQYCFFPEPETIWSKGCLKEINKYITQLMDAHKQGYPQKKVRNVLKAEEKENATDK